MTKIALQRIWKRYQYSALKEKICKERFFALDRSFINHIHDVSDNTSQETSPKDIYHHHIPTPPLHHTHRCEFIGHVCPYTKKCRTQKYLKVGHFSLYSWHDDKNKKDSYIEQIKQSSGNQVWIFCKILWYVLLENRHDDKINHDTVDCEKGNNPRDVGKNSGKHRKRGKKLGICFILNPRSIREICCYFIAEHHHTWYFIWVRLENSLFHDFGECV